MLKRAIEIKTIPIKLGKKTILVEQAEILYLKISNGYVICYANKGTNHIIDYTVNDEYAMIPRPRSSA